MLKYYKKVVKASAFFGKCDMVYASSPHPLTWIAGRKIAEKNNAKFIAETRDLWPETFISMGKFSKSHPVVKILYAIEKKIYKKADKLIFTMPGGVDYVESLGISTDKVVNINNGVDLKEFAEYMFYDFMDDGNHDRYSITKAYMDKNKELSSEEIAIESTVTENAPTFL